MFMIYFFILLFVMIIEGQLCELVGEYNPMHYQIIHMHSIRNDMNHSILDAFIGDFEEFCKDLIDGKYPGIKEIKGTVGI